jgi:hypothetical protein
VLKELRGIDNGRKQTVPKKNPLITEERLALDALQVLIRYFKLEEKKKRVSMYKKPPGSQKVPHGANREAMLNAFIANSNRWLTTAEIQKASGVHLSSLHALLKRFADHKRINETSKWQLSKATLLQKKAMELAGQPSRPGKAWTRRGVAMKPYGWHKDNANKGKQNAN